MDKQKRIGIPELLSIPSLIGGIVSERIGVHKNDITRGRIQKLDIVDGCLVIVCVPESMARQIQEKGWKYSERLNKSPMYSIPLSEASANNPLQFTVVTESHYCFRKTDDPSPLFGYQLDLIPKGNYEESYGF